MPGAFPRGKGGRCVRLATLPQSCAIVTKSGNLNFLEPSGSLQACNGTALPFLHNTNRFLIPLSVTFHSHLHDILCRCLWYLRSFLSYCLQFQRSVIFSRSQCCLSSLCSCSKKICLNAQVAFFTPFALAVSDWLLQFRFLAFTASAVCWISFLG